MTGLRIIHEVKVIKNEQLLPLGTALAARGFVDRSHGGQDRSLDMLFEKQVAVPSKPSDRTGQIQINRVHRAGGDTFTLQVSTKPHDAGSARVSAHVAIEGDPAQAAFLTHVFTDLDHGVHNSGYVARLRVTDLTLTDLSALEAIGHRLHAAVRDREHHLRTGYHARRAHRHYDAVTKPDPDQERGLKTGLSLGDFHFVSQLLARGVGGHAHLRDELAETIARVEQIVREDSGLHAAMAYVAQKPEQAVA